jgi:NAD(P)-dependent dehydrogenase (short-subunit alcohol dehydrogenase family)
MKAENTVLITGASGGIGLALTEALLTTGGYNIVCHYRTRETAISELLRNRGIDSGHHLVRADLTNEDEVALLQAAVHRRFGPLYGLINLAGASSNAMTWKMTRAQFEETVSDNLLTTFLTCRQFIPEMREQNRGRIINISSVVAHTGVAGASHYCAAKAGIIGFTKAMARELAPRNISASVIALGYFDYGMIHTIPDHLRESIRQTIPAQRFGNIDSLAGLISFLLGDAGSYAGGQVYNLNGGLYS